MHAQSVEERTELLVELKVCDVCFLDPTDAHDKEKEKEKGKGELRDCYCTIYADKAVIGRTTTVYQAERPLFNENFEFEVCVRIGGDYGLSFFVTSSFVFLFPVFFLVGWLLVLCLIARYCRIWNLSSWKCDSLRRASARTGPSATSSFPSRS
jgi:hypothetical protein